jgi:hypothetical protein
VSAAAITVAIAMFIVNLVIGRSPAKRATPNRCAQ